MARLADLVRSGFADWHERDDRTVELRLATGEVFVLSERTITRTA